MKILTLLFVIAVLLSSCHTGAASSENHLAQKAGEAQAQIPVKSGKIRSEEARELLNRQQEVVILDIRSQGEWDAGHLKGARRIDFYDPEFAQHLQALDPADTYLVYCAVGGRSQEAAKLMQKLGFRQVYDATEGFEALKEAGIPVE